ncbi:MAG: HEAT repeat domain-containing protein [Candidatus Binatia bacterium]
MSPDESSPAARPVAEADRAALVAALARIESGNALQQPGDAERLAACLGHPDKHVRLHAASALAAELGRGGIDEALCRSWMGSDDEQVRWGAAFAASKAGLLEDQVVAIALSSLDSGDGDVRWAAASLVVAAARQSEAVRKQLRDLVASGSNRRRKMAVLCLCDCGERDGRLYREALGDVDSFVRMAALTSMARNGDRSSDSLAAIAATAAGDGEANVRRAAAAVLRRLTA